MDLEYCGCRSAVCLSVCTFAQMYILLNKRDRIEERKTTRLEILGSDSLARKLEAGPWGL